MAKRLTKSEKEILYSKLSELGSEVSKAEAMEICRPFHDLLYDEEKAKEQALGRMTARVLKKVRFQITSFKIRRAKNFAR